MEQKKTYENADIEVIDIVAEEYYFNDMDKLTLDLIEKETH